MKTDDCLDRRPLKGALGDALHAVLCGAGQNIGRLLKMSALFCPDWNQVHDHFTGPSDNPDRCYNRINLLFSKNSVGTTDPVAGATVNR